MNRGTSLVRRPLLLLGVAVFTTACATDGSFVKSATPAYPPSWSALADSAGANRGDWLGTLGDPALVAVVDDALKANYDIQAARARLGQARAGARAAGAGRLPTLDADFSASRTDVKADATPEVDSFGVGLSASWEADVWGRLSDRARAGKLDEAAAAADLADARLALAGAVAQGWYDLVEASLQVALSEDEVATQERSLRLTQRRYEAGVSGALDVRLARSQLASAEAGLAARRTFQNDSARRLEVLLGRYPKAEIRAAPDLPALADLESLGAIGAPGDILLARPDVRASEARLVAAGLRASEARKALLPRLSFSGGVGTSTTDVSDVLDGDFLVNTVAGSVLQPIFRGGLLRSEALRTKEVQRERLANYAAVVLAAFGEAEGAIDADGSLEVQEAALSRAAEEAREAEKLAERAYTRGVGTIFELLDAQRRRISAQRAFIQTRGDRVANRINLHLAVGGDFRTPSETVEGRAQEEDIRS